MTIKALAKTSLTFLLLTTLVIQPVMFSYAMASMSHHDGHMMMNTSHQMDHGAMHDHTMSSDTDEQSSVLDNCCASPACAGAPLSSFDLSITRHITPYTLTSSHFWSGIIIPSEIKPPRS